MKKLLLLSLFILSSVGTIQAQTPTTFTPEGLAEKLQTVDGKEISFQEILKKYEGKTIVMDVWASWCKDCVAGMPKLKTLQSTFKKDVVYLFISMDKNAEAWKKGIEKYDVKGEHYLVSDGMKGVFGKSITLDWIPRYMVIDKKGKIALYKAIEADDKNLNTILKKIK
ncbi:TlpA family protein disulfide reductase [Flavobacterium sp. '19STA2R22 D10 B1']|uniref:TlpA family protein disulfide reductase n=1 Tax=Flavobacterium aerium TaxID=3037261 RepID=UPI00278BE242|nr:TlpA disulfide reductase family protein [Flavobacterium sp. '19STA2R22 D10 B1']